MNRLNNDSDQYALSQSDYSPLCFLRSGLNEPQIIAMRLMILKREIHMIRQRVEIVCVVFYLVDPGSDFRNCC
jgi:hypothetical protein